MANAVFKLIDNTLKAAEKNAVASPEDYKNADGLLVCGKCHTLKQKFFKFTENDGELYERFKNRIFPIVCKCRREQQEAEERARKKRDTELLIERFRKEGITDSNYLNHTFEKDDNKNPEISRACKIYAEKFIEMYKLGKGLMFCGQVGTGKTFYACSIANAILSQARSVLVTNIPSLITRLGFSQADKNYILGKISSVALLVIDDLGVERDTPYALEKVYEIIDTRYRAAKPLIITTNLQLKDMANCESPEYRRIYDRILQMCHPIAVTGESRRKTEARRSFEFMNDFLGLKNK